MAESSIEWTDATWNPTVGCSRVSAGCTNCYAERVAHRGMSPDHRGLTVLGKHGPRWTGEVRFIADRLAVPLRWRKPRRVFVDSMSDLFHEGVSFEEIAAVFGIMAAASRHTFQVLTKRPERAAAFFLWLDGQTDRGPLHAPLSRAGVLLSYAQARCEHRGLLFTDEILSSPWPLPNVWLGVSVEDQATADERIPHLLACPAAVRFVSYEPALGPVDFERIRYTGGGGTHLDVLNGLHGVPNVWRDPATRLDWIIVGGESGPGARQFDVAWARSTIEQCRAAGVAVFVKQLGTAPRFALGDVLAVPCDGYGYPRLRDRKGGDWTEWPEDLRVREWPGR